MQSGLANHSHSQHVVHSGCGGQVFVILCMTPQVHDYDYYGHHQGAEVSMMPLPSSASATEASLLLPHPTFAGDCMCNHKAKSGEILMFVCLQKDA